LVDPGLLVTRFVTNGLLEDRTLGAAEVRRALTVQSLVGGLKVNDFVADARTSLGSSNVGRVAHLLAVRMRGETTFRPILCLEKYEQFQANLWRKTISTSFLQAECVKCVLPYIQKEDGVRLSFPRLHV